MKAFFFGHKGSIIITGSNYQESTASLGAATFKRTSDSKCTENFDGVCPPKAVGIRGVATRECCQTGMLGAESVEVQDVQQSIYYYLLYQANGQGRFGNT